ncbi:hypothetical protein PVL29_023182 [Vitis rotundifolia]|uniref:RING-type domain-containing protein n=1 Tax=Vitis rotundifolia TaxID=103349 RepID=A0AA38YN07_VITRO|nr:hypothetical protein PVL29_023182 [Vitis rotundifolia]
MNVTVTAIEALLLLCAGMTALFVLYFLLLRCFAFPNQSELRRQGKSRADEGLSTSELEKLPKLAGKDMTVTGMECAVCLEEIEGDELARVVPACNHGFHLECADTWLSKHSACPLCRAPIRPGFHYTSENLC